MPDNTPSPYTLIIRATTAERTLPAVPAAGHLNGIGVTFNDPKGTLDTVELIWDTEAHSVITTKDMWSSEFTKTLHSRYTIHNRYKMGVRVQVEGVIHLIF